MKKQTAGREQLGEFAPKFAELNDDVLFGEVWSRTTQLSLRDRSFLTITALISQGITDNSLRYHLQTAKNNGITKTEIAEILTQIGFYAGWPKAWAAFHLAKEIWHEESMAIKITSKEDFVNEMKFPIGEANSAYAQYFTGQSYLAPLANGDCSAHNVTFEPGCRNHWHIHHGQNQLLICVAGEGWYQAWGEKAIHLKAGDVIDIPAEVKHWHGATKDSWFAHIAVMVPKQGATTEWCEPVTEEQYEVVHTTYSEKA